MYRENVANAVSVFLDGINKKNKTLINIIENPMSSHFFSPELRINSFFDHNGFDIIETGPFCAHS